MPTTTLFLMSHHEQIRPRVADMRDMDGDQPWVDWPPAARAVRTKPPAVSRPGDTPREEAAAPRPIMGEIRERDSSSGHSHPAPPGKRISAFRRSRMERAAAPPTPQVAHPVPPCPRDPSRDPGGGAAPEAMTSLLQDISNENEERIASMSYETRAEELRDAEAFFGQDTLAKLAERMEQAMPTNRGWPALERRAVDLDAPPPAMQKKEHDERDAWESFRRQYFPDEPDAVPPALAWTVTASAPSGDSVRFDFEGRVTTDTAQRDAEAPDETYLAGLHHHGQEQNVPGYTLEELLHLARSTVASQRVLALQVLQRICTAPSSPSADRVLTADGSAMRGRIVLSAVWLLHDRHKSVRTAAGQCLDAACKALSVVPHDAFVAAAMPTSADAELDMLWHDAAWTPYARAPHFHAQDASHLELAQRHWPHALRQSHVLRALDMWLEDHAADTIVSLLHALVMHDATSAKDLVQYPRLLHVVVQLGATKRPWPLVDAPYPSYEALLVLWRVIQSDRRTAQSLWEQGAVDPLLRYVLMPPCDSTSSSPDVREHEQALLYLTLRILTALGRYGVGSTSVREVAPAIPRLAQWSISAASALPMNDAAWHTIRALYEMLEVWTRAAHKGSHHGDLGLNEPIVHAWAPYPQALLERLPPTPLSPVCLSAYGAAILHLAAWTQSASQWGHQARVQVTMSERLVQEVSMQVTRVSSLLTTAQVREVRRASSDLAYIASVLGGLVRLAPSTSLDTWCQRVLDLPLGVMATPAVRANGLSMPQLLHVLAMCSCSAAPAVQVRLLSWLPPCEVVYAERCLESLVRALDASAWTVLMPFFRDDLRYDQRPPSMIEAETHAETLCMPHVLPPQDVSDPQTGATLRSSPVSGLPLRRDWPLLVLDDLLHSSDARALNAPHALPASWDFTEMDMVRAALQLAVPIASLGAAPSAFWWLGIYKVFLLEQAAPATHEASGAVTGRDLYMDATVAHALRALMDKADDMSHSAEPTLEEATSVTHAGSMPFYQVYTDLMGLYDAVSMHHPLFARALIPPLAMVYAPDYRRLLWSDYAALLRGITIDTHDVPVVCGQRLEAYLWPCESDEIVLVRYVDALVQRLVTPAQPFLYAVALHHVSAAFWSARENGWGDVSIPPALAQSMARRVFTAEAGNHVLTYAPHDAHVYSPDVRQAMRAQWLDTK